MAQSELISIANQFKGLPFESLIGGPLKAAAEANAVMAMTQTKFMLDTCFQKKEIPQPNNQNNPNAAKVYNYTPIMIKMSVTRTEANPDAGQAGAPATITRKLEIEVPLMTIIPLNSLAVETVDIDFEMEVKSSFSEETNQTSEKERQASAEFEAKGGWGPLSVSIRGNASYTSKDTSSRSTHYQKSNSARYNVSVHAGQLPLPAGVHELLTALTPSTGAPTS